MKVVSHEKFEGVYWLIDAGRRMLATRNLAPGVSVYNERLVSFQGSEYRLWDPHRSKLAAATVKGLSEFPIRSGSIVLYLGAASGTTLSHMSDIIGEEGWIVGVEFSPRTMTQFSKKVARHRNNVLPVLEDARDPSRYRGLVGGVEVIYCDIAQPEQAKILADNADLMLDEGGGALLAVKARSIDSVASPSEMFDKEIQVLNDRGFEVTQKVHLEPYDRDHLMVVARYER